MKRTSFISGLLSCSLWLACAVNGWAAEAPQSPALPTKEEMLQLLSAHKVPGVAMATLARCEVDQVVVAGAASLAPQVEVHANTAFEAASLSKPVFAWLVLTLVDEGIVDLDRPMAESFSYARIPDKAAYAMITPRMVLTHRTGLPNWVDEQIDFAVRKTPIPFKAPPGSSYSYSGEAFQLLQAFVEHRTGKTLQQLFRERLGELMPNSTFVRPLPEGVLASRGYQSATDPKSGRDMNNLSDQAMAASSLATTAGDYARFLSHVCKAQRLKIATYAEMLRPQSPVPPGEAALPGSYGLGWLIARLDKDNTLVGHGGNNDEYRSLAGFVRENGDGIVILTNGAKGQAVIDVLAEPPPPATPPAEASSGAATGLSAPEAVFERFWAIYNESYALFGVKHVDWDAVYRVYRPRVNAKTRDDELWALLAEMGRLLNDVHVSLRDPATGRQTRSGGRSIGVGPFDNGEFSLDLIAKSYAMSGLQGAAGDTFRYGWLPEHIGYVHIRSFRDPEGSARTMDAIVQALASAKGLIVDVRHNSGGDDRAGRLIANRLAAEPRPYMTVAQREAGQLPPAFSAPTTWRLEPAGPQQFTGPIVLLINSRSISAAENFALALRALPHALLMGETTAGVMADTRTQTLPNGWQVTVSTNLFRDANGISWEGIGITPDLWVKNEAADIAAGNDRVLQRALDFLRAGAVKSWDRSAQMPGNWR